MSCFVCPGTDQARGLAQTLLNVPYGDGDGEKLDVYIPSTNSLGTDVMASKTYCNVTFQICRNMHNMSQN